MACPSQLVFNDGGGNAVNVCFLKNTDVYALLFYTTFLAGISGGRTPVALCTNVHNVFMCLHTFAVFQLRYVLVFILQKALCMRPQDLPYMPTVGNPGICTIKKCGQDNCHVDQ